MTKIENIDCRQNEKMLNHTTIKIGGEVSYFFEPKNFNELKKIIEFCKQKNLKIALIGNGSNILFSSRGFNGAVIKVSKNFIFSYKLAIKTQRKRIFLIKNKLFYKFLNNKTAINKLYFCTSNKSLLFFSSGKSISFLSNYCCNLSLSGLEFAVSIPGTLGGAIRMNAGAFDSEISKNILSVLAYDFEQNKFVNIGYNQCNFSYRHSIFMEKKSLIILGAFLILNRKPQSFIKDKMSRNIAHRIATQSVGYPSAGSVFKRTPNFIPALWFDQHGFKGARFGDAMLSPVHSGYIVNLGNATSDDVIRLIDFLSKRVLQISNFVLELEIEKMGDF